MATFLNILFLVGGLTVLGGGGEWLVRGSARLARSLGVSALVVGLTVVAFGTSAPELAVSVQAVLEGRSSIAVGNVVGSNIANVLLIFGVAAAARPFKVSLNLIRTDAPIMVVVAAVFVGLSFSQTGPGVIGRFAGVALTSGLLAYTAFTYYMSRREPRAVETEFQDAIGEPGSMWLNVVLVVAGIIGLVAGGRLIVMGAVGIAETVGIDEGFVGLTIVAIGTSLPELATSIIAVRHKQADIAVGNVVGSNISNILMVVGVSAIVAPVEVSRETMWWDNPVMLAVCALLLAVCRTGHRVSRWEGIALLALYAGYLAWTAVRAVGA